MDPLISEFGFEIADLLKPWIAILASAIIALWLKDSITSLEQEIKNKIKNKKFKKNQIK